MGSNREAGLKRLACQLVAQLPDERGDALAALEYARGIVDHLSGEARVIPLRETRLGMSLVSAPDEAEAQPAPRGISSPA